MIKLGVRVKCKITGFVGIAAGRSQYLTGCDQYCVTPPSKDGEYKTSHWIDEGQLEVLGEGISPDDVSDKDDPGGPKECYPRTN